MTTAAESTGDQPGELQPRGPGRWPALPGRIAVGLLLVVTTLWTYWGAVEMYWEGWWGPILGRLAYLAPGMAFLALTLVAVAWPRAGAWLLIVLGSAWTVWVIQLQLSRGAEPDLAFVLAWFPVTGLAVVAGLTLLHEGRRRRRLRAAGRAARPRLSYAVVVAVPLLVVALVSAYWLPVLAARDDDGHRGARLVEGHGVALVWAPAGPGWNWRQPWGGYPSWDALARYGVTPVGLDEDKLDDRTDEHATAQDMAATGLCRYLSADGRSLTDAPQGIWRLPTADEVVRSLTGHGENAGCTWDGESGRAGCELGPDKETPLWAPDEAPIYYWVVDELDATSARYVAYNASVSGQPKSFGNPRHGYRCVREPESAPPAFLPSR